MVKGELATRPVRVTPEKEATPLVAFWVIVPPKAAEPETERVTLAEDEVTVLPYWSSMVATMDAEAAAVDDA